jgi:hypothetical protein
MFTIIFLVFCSIRQGFRTRVALQTETLALRHPLLVLERSSRGHRLRLSNTDRLLWTLILANFEVEGQPTSRNADYHARGLGLLA